MVPVVGAVEAVPEPGLHSREAEAAGGVRGDQAEAVRWPGCPLLANSLGGRWGRANLGRHMYRVRFTISQLINPRLGPGARVWTLPCRQWGAISILEQVRHPLST